MQYMLGDRGLGTGVQDTCGTLECAWLVPYTAPLMILSMSK